MESGSIEDQSFFDPNRVPKELWKIILSHLSVERKYYPVVNEIEFILPFLKLVCKRFQQAVKDYVIEKKITEKSHNRRIATMPVLAEWGALSCLKLMREYGVKWSEGTCEMAARGGHYETLKYARENGCLWNVSSMYKSMSVNAGAGGNIEVIKYLQAHNCQMDGKACEKAAEYGHLEAYKYLRSIGCEVDNFGALAKLVIKNGHVNILKYIHEDERKLIVNSQLFYDQCHIDCMKYLRSIGCPFHAMACYRAAEAGNLEALKYAHENDAYWSADVLKAAASNGKLSCIQYLIENKCPIPDDISCVLIAGYHWQISSHTKNFRANVLECLKYVHQQGVELSSAIMRVAAENNRLDCIQYAHENGVPWDESVYIAAITSNKSAIDTMKYAHENGCPWSSKVFVRAIIEGTEKQLQYLVQEGCPLDKDGIIAAIKHERLFHKPSQKRVQSRIDYLKTLGVDIDIDVAAIVAANPVNENVQVYDFMF